MLTREVEARRQAGNAMGAVAAARVALSLIRGEGPQPLPGEWAQLRHAELERLIGRARVVAATALVDAGESMAAADAASAALERDPYDEAALRVLLRAYVMGGRVAGALAAYASARERMADELGTDPSPETAALYTAILRGELVAPARPSAGAAMGPVGRDDELAYLEAIAARARGGSVEVVVVDGEAGIGKTTLLRAWAGRRAAAGDTVLRPRAGRWTAPAARRAGDRAGRAAARARTRADRRHAGRRRGDTGAVARRRRPARGRRRCWPTACSARRCFTRHWPGSWGGSPSGRPLVAVV